MGHRDRSYVPVIFNMYLFGEIIRFDKYVPGSSVKDTPLSSFFIKIDDWLSKENNAFSCFWILGV